MRPPTTNGITPRLSSWLRVREFAVPPSMIETATERRQAGDWSGACAAAGFDLDLDPAALRRSHGRELSTRVHDDLLHLAPDLLRWHMPRIAPDGFLRPGLTVALARYGQPAGEIPFGKGISTYLVARTAPTWADAGQRISLAVWDGSASTPHPHPRPDRRFRLDLHRHLWDARRTDELRTRSGTGLFAAALPQAAIPEGGAVDRWSAESAILLRADRQRGGLVRVRFGGRRELIMDTTCGDPPGFRVVNHPVRGRISALPVLPDAATWILPDLELLRHGAITPDRLHPLVAAALVPDWSPPRTQSPPRTLRAPDPGDGARVHCGGDLHRIGLVDGVLVALDHDPDEIRREELLVALTGTPLPCLQAIDRAHRRPDCLEGVRERLDHGDVDGALAVVEGLLGSDAALRDGPLRDALRTVATRRDTYERFRAGLTEPFPPRVRVGRRRAHPRHATAR